MQTVWNVPGRTSGVNPAAFASGEPPPSLPPDPPDPASPLSPVNFPSLIDSTSNTVLNGRSRKGLRKEQRSLSITTSSTEQRKDATTSSESITMEIEQETQTLSTTSTVPETSSPSFPTIPSPLLPAPVAVNPIPVPSTFGLVEKPVQNQTLLEKLRASADNTLRRLAPITITPSGRPRVVIPDTVFRKGAEIHKDYIICYFNGKSLPYNQIQSVFNYMWGKGKKLEIHNNPLNHSAIVRIQSEYLRNKILEKNIWYVGDSMFHTAQWNSDHSMSTPPLKAIKIWVHLTGVPLDLRYDEGLSLVAGLVGEPKETDDFTKNMVSLTVSHVKVEVDLTAPLPPVVEFERESGEVVEVLVHYPWVPPTCSHCHELGHIVRNCLSYSPPPAPETEKSKASVNPETHPKTPQKPLQKPQASKSSFTPAKTSKKAQKRYQPVLNPLAFEPAPTIPVPQSSSSHLPAPIKALSDLMFPHSTSNDTAKVTFSSPDPPPRPSLKRSRSSPTLSPPSSSKAIPFSDKQNPFLPLTDNLFDPNIPLPSPKSPDPTFKQKTFTFGSIGHPPPEDPPNPSQ
ncbi:hypothetical protein IGI04_015868 [Brassica rapa subsp. trilocularis]|uniref:DUF4283 domain-containing protein n=1 Tax=Brassica rapa subsp. trilocularis TaxID=1813537 RepID=A0ABQ7MTS8_BRACM|nr:hypothetical protein IGI04_015868 [Brassica rapa subsp. trilocularis]